jgi:tetratricopeptide (TPR) repeat protein
VSRESKHNNGPEAAVATPPIPSFALRGWLFVVFLFGTTLIAYLPVWHAGFVWDDDYWLAANPLTKDPHGWFRFWYATKTADYYPLTSSAFWIEWRLWGMNAAGYHVVNVLIHVTDAVLLWRLLVRLDIPGAKLAAAIFALHPVNVESVAWITELKDTLAMFFLLLTLLFYLRFDDTRLRRWYWISVAVFVLALLSKSAVAPLPLVLLGIAWWRRGRVGSKDILQSAAFFGAAGALALLTIWFQYHNSIGNIIVRTDGFWSRLAIAGRAVWFYLYKAALPVDLIPVYPRWSIGTVSLVSFLPGLMLAMVFFLCWKYRATWGKGPLFALGCFVVMLLPILGFLNISFFAHSLVADHWQYFAIAGVIALAAAGITKVMDPFPGCRVIVSGTLLLVLGVLTWRQANIYRDSETLWQATLERNPRSWSAYNYLGYALLRKGKVDEAITQLQLAVQINPAYEDTHNNLGNAFLQKDNVDEAIDQFQQALQINPDLAATYYNLGNALLQKGKGDEAIVQFQKALQISPDFADAHNNLGNVLLKKGRLDEAIAQFQQVLQFDPDAVDAHYNLGNALFQEGRVDDAISQFQQALQFNRDDAAAHYNLGNALLQKGSLDEAISHFQKAVEINPDYADAYNNLGEVLLQKGNADDAVGYFEKALEIKPGLAVTHYNLGNALFQEGNVDEAITQFQQALEIKPDYAVAQNNLGNAFLQMGKIDEAILHFQKAVEINPDYLEAHYNLGVVFLREGKTDEAILHLQKALDLAQAAGQLNLVDRLNTELKSLRAGSSTP